MILIAQNFHFVTCHTGGAENPYPKIHHQISIKIGVTKDFGSTLGTSKVSDARRRGVTTEAYQQYAAGRNDRRQRRR